MRDARYYRAEADHMRRLASLVHQPAIQVKLREAARDFEEIAQDLEGGLIEVRHPEMLPQNNR
jgi:hypothetical protein